MTTTPDLKKIEYKALDDLLLDAENPRFAGTDAGTSQQTIAKTLWDEMFLEELIISIAVNGFYVQEPLLVVPDGKQPGKYIVVEGNRRLASVKILTDIDLAKKVKALNLPTPSAQVLASLNELPVIVYENRNQLWQYLSFRHVNGPRGWSSISKAEFVYGLHKDQGIDFDEILSSTGDKNKTSLKMYNGLVILKQAESQTNFQREDFNASKFNFSHLYTMIGYENTKKHLGITGIDQSKPFPDNPVPDEKLENLEELMGWIFGSKSLKQQPIIKTQNPDLRNLDKILKHTEALIALRDGDSLSVAFEYTGEENYRLQTLVIKASQSLAKAVGLMDSFRGDTSIVDHLEKIQSLSSDMLEKAKTKE